MAAVIPLYPEQEKNTSEEKGKTRQTMKITPKQHRLINWGLIALAIGLRFYNLGAAPLWYDEAFTDLATSLPLSKMIQALAGDVHPPAHYFMLWAMQRIGLGSTWGLRLLSALFSVVSVYLAGHLAREITEDPWIETITIGLMAFAPMNLHYGQEARMYALLQLVVLIGLVAIYNRRWAVLTIAAALAALTHTYGLFYCLGLAVAALLEARKEWARWIPAFGLAGLIWLPWGIVMLRQMQHLQSSGYWIQPVTVGRVLRAIEKNLFSFALPSELSLGCQIMMGAGLVVMIVTLARIWKKDNSWLSLVVLAALPTLLAVIASWLYRPVLLFRPLIGSLPMLLILIAVVIQAQEKPGKILAAVIMIPLLIGMALGYHKYNLINKADSQPWIEAIREEWQPGSVVYALNDSSALAMLHGAPDLPCYKFPDCPDQASLGALTPQTREALGIIELPPDQLPDTYFTILSLSPVSPLCEVERGHQAADHDKRIYDIFVSEFVEAGVFLHESR